MHKPLLLNSADAALAISVPERTLRKLAAEGAIPVVRVGRHYRYSPDDLQRWIVENKQTTTVSGEAA